MSKVFIALLGHPIRIPLFAPVLLIKRPVHERKNVSRLLSCPLISTQNYVVAVVVQQAVSFAECSKFPFSRSCCMGGIFQTTL